MNVYLTDMKVCWCRRTRRWRRSSWLWPRPWWSGPGGATCTRPGSRGRPLRSWTALGSCRTPPWTTCWPGPRGRWSPRSPRRMCPCSSWWTRKHLHILKYQINQKKAFKSVRRAQMRIVWKYVRARLLESLRVKVKCSTLKSMNRKNCILWA